MLEELIKWVREQLRLCEPGSPEAITYAAVLYKYDQLVGEVVAFDNDNIDEVVKEEMRRFHKEMSGGKDASS